MSTLSPIDSIIKIFLFVIKYLFPLQHQTRILVSKLKI
jgi:hypothetical protein